MIINCWTHNYNRNIDGYITHAYDESSEQFRSKNRAICGVQVADSGWVALGEDGWKPGCLRCRKILIGRGLLRIEEDANNKDGN